MYQQGPAKKHHNKILTNFYAAAGNEEVFTGNPMDTSGIKQGGETTFNKAAGPPNEQAATPPSKGASSTCLLPS